jgi:hypothetical protein
LEVPPPSTLNITGGGGGEIGRRKPGGVEDGAPSFPLVGDMSHMVNSHILKKNVTDMIASKI